jgi:tetratricopeptide (TPR) repeat protein
MTRNSRRMARAARTSVLALSLIVLVGGGCSNSAKKPTPQEQAKVQWNAARSGVLVGLAKDQYEAGEFDKAKQTINDALKLSPQSAPAHIMAARIAIEQAQLEVAERELRLAGEFDPRNAEADYLSGVVYQRWQKPDLAYECYTHANEKAPSELAYLMARSEMLVSMDRAPEALKLLQDRVVYFEHSAAIRDAVGQLLIQQKQYNAAMQMENEAAILTPDDMTIREHQAMAQFYARQYDQASMTLARLTSQDKFTKRSDLYACLGECYDHLGRHREARDAFETATKLDPSTPGLWLGLGKAAMQLNDIRRADLSLKKAIALDPTNPECKLLLGYLRLRQQRLPEALAAFRQVSDSPEADPVSLCMTGYVLQKLGHTDEAIKYYGRALKRNPNDELANKLMASVDVHE